MLKIWIWIFLLYIFSEWWCNSAMAYI